MNKKGFFQSVIANVVLIAVFFVVALVGFLPESATPIWSTKNIKAYYNGNQSKRCVSIMFNVYENTQVVNAIIDVLNERGIKATFFVGGCWADDNAQTLVRLVNDGHEIANHGYFHKDHKKLNYQQNAEEIRLTASIVKALCGYETKLFAPPSGSYSQTTLQVAEDLGYKTIMWSKDTIDWRDSDQKKLIERATKNATGGDLVLMHPKEHTLKALPKILDYYYSIGLNVVTVSENICV